MFARFPRRTLLQCRHETRDGGSRYLGIPITLAPRDALATVIARVPRRTLLRCRHETQDGGPPTSRDSNHTRTPSRTRYSDRTCPVAYVCYSVDTRYDGPSRAIFRALPVIAIRIQPYGSKALVEGYDGLTSFLGRNFSNPDILRVNPLMNSANSAKKVRIFPFFLSAIFDTFRP